jgi:hypothetical protein
MNVSYLRYEGMLRILVDGTSTYHNLMTWTSAHGLDEHPYVTARSIEIVKAPHPAAYNATKWIPPCEENSSHSNNCVRGVNEILVLTCDEVKVKEWLKKNGIIIE